MANIGSRSDRLFRGKETGSTLRAADDPPFSRTLLSKAKFLLGARRAIQFPADQGVEVAIAGRSNAGKSSALNAITGQRALARTSKTPGRTREINFFSLDDARRLVDLPGYGYAKAPEAVRREWAHTVERYLEGRRSLRGLLLVMDVRHPFTDFDERLIAWCDTLSLPLHILLTKSDKLGKNRQRASLLGARQHLAGCGDRVTVQLFSAPKRLGVEDVHACLSSWLGEPVEPPSAV